jgi:tetratricopeptide (TPR) repeat protein
MSERETSDELPSLPLVHHKLTLAFASTVIVALIICGLWNWQTGVRPLSPVESGKATARERTLVESGNAMAREWRLDEAIAAYRQAIRLRPDYADAHTNLGIALVKQQEKPSEAVVVLREAIRLKPGDASAHFALGTALHQLMSRGEHGQRKLDEVIREYREAVRLYPGSADASFALGKLLSRLGRFDEAITAYQDATRAKYVPEVVYYALGEAERARDSAAGGRSPR